MDDGVAKLGQLLSVAQRPRRENLLLDLPHRRLYFLAEIFRNGPAAQREDLEGAAAAPSSLPPCRADAP